MKKLIPLLFTSVLLFGAQAQASVVLPYTFSTGTIRASEANADLGALRDEINGHEANHNGHNTALTDVLSVNNSCGTTSINFNETQGLGFRTENVTADPTAGNSGRLIYNSTSNLLKVDNGSSFVSIAGTGVNTLTSVLNAGNSAGTFNLDLNYNQLLHGRVENLVSDPVAGNSGRLFFNTTSSTLKVDTGSVIQAIGGAQGLSSVLGVSNSAGSTSINFNGTQAINIQLESLSADPGTTNAGRIYYNSTSSSPKFYNGTSWLQVGNTNTLSQVLALGNSAGSSDIDFNSHQAKNMRIHNLAAPPGTGSAGMIWYDTINNNLGYETTTANHIVCSLDDTQTLTNKTISGSSNTITNVPDSALSANVALLNSAQTISGTKTFSAAPVISNIKTSAGTTLGHTIPNGLADDTFVLANAVQTLAGKTLNAPTLSGNIDFSEYQGVRMRVENGAATPSAGNPGRIFYKSSTGEFLWDNGTQWNSIASATIPSVPSWSQVLAQGASAGTTNPDVNENQLLHARTENVASMPAAGNPGRIVFNTANSAFYVDTGSAWLTPLTVATPVIVTSNYTIGSTDRYVFVNSAAATSITLPDATAVSGVPIVIKNIGAGFPTIGTVLGQTIDGQSSITINVQYASLNLIAVSGAWYLW